MAVELVIDTFEPRLGEHFTATPSLGDAPLDLELSRCEQSPHARPGHADFALVFLAPGPEHHDQQIFSVEHPDLGGFDLFLVPLGPQDGRMVYEAVVNN